MILKKQSPERKTLRRLLQQYEAAKWISAQFKDIITLYTDTTFCTLFMQQYDWILTSLPSVTDEQDMSSSSVVGIAIAATKA